MIPSGIASATAMSVDRMASSRLSAKRSLISSMIGAPVHIDVPKSRRTSPPIQSTNWRQSGLSRPRRARSMVMVSFDAAPPSPAKRSSTMSPGTTRIRKKMSTATPISVGIISRIRLTMYLVMPDGRLRYDQA